MKAVNPAGSCASYGAKRDVLLRLACFLHAYMCPMLSCYAPYSQVSKGLQRLTALRLEHSCRSCNHAPPMNACALVAQCRIKARQAHTWPSPLVCLRSGRGWGSRQSLCQMRPPSCLPSRLHGPPPLLSSVAPALQTPVATPTQWEGQRCRPGGAPGTERRCIVGHCLYLLRVWRGWQQPALLHAAMRLEQVLQVLQNSSTIAKGPYVTAFRIVSCHQKLFNTLK